MAAGTSKTEVQSIEIVLNGEKRRLEAEPDLNVEGLLKLEKVESPDMVSVQHNGRILARDEFALTRVQSGDELDFLYFMGGGSSSYRGLAWL